MKLDKLQFAQVIAHCISNGMSAGEYEINTLDNLIDIDVPLPTVQHVLPNPEALEGLMKAIHEGKKIEAIKSYRELTPDRPGLKEAKDAVEKDWKHRYSKEELLKKLVGDQSHTMTETKRDIIHEFLEKLLD